MLTIARDLNGVIIDAKAMDYDTWNTFKKLYKIGELKMICCNSNAVPKTSSNFLQYFAHQSDECNSSSETIWHKMVKKLIFDSITNQGINAVEEKIGKGWIADVYFEIHNRKIIFEVQHSSQTLETFKKRQKKYNDNGIECIWILPNNIFKSLSKSIGKYKLKFEERSKEKPFIITPTLENLPYFYFDIENMLIKSVGHFEIEFQKFIDETIKGEKWNILNRINNK